jgi:dTMP kinase
MFITFEGCEGCGKSTHVQMLAEYLRSLGKDVITTKEPGGTPLGKQLREMLLQQEPEVMSEIFLFAADRIEHVEKVIRPALNQGKIVLCDRFMDSTLAYQLGGRGLPEDLVRYLNWVSSRGLIPDMTIMLDVTVEEGLKRAKDRGPIDRFEKEIVAFHERVRDKYNEIAENEPQRIKKINSALPMEQVQEKILELVKEKIK